MGGTVGRIALGVATGGLSEVARGVGGLVNRSLSPAQPQLFGGPPAVKKLAQSAANAVQSKEAEARRLRASKRASTVLTSGLGLPGTAPTSTATLQPASPNRSVLG